MEPPGGDVLIVGNDVVDLTAERTRGKSANQRFVKRILDPVEQSYLTDSAEPDLELWALWAAKEAAYKIATKLRGAPPVFEHASFGVRWSGGQEETSGTGVRTGTVRWQDVEVVMVVTLQPGWAHAVGHALVRDVPSAGSSMDTIGVGLGRLDDTGAVWADAEEVLMKRFTPREADAVYSRPSAAVRVAARASLAEALSVEEARLEILCTPGQKGRRPPWVFLDGEPASADVSLSHDGPWLGWAWSVSPQYQRGR